MLLTALIMGFAGSLHCVSMCSPLAMAVTNISSRAWLNRLTYNAGRILTYSALGTIVAIAGFATPLSRFQNLISIVLGLCLLLIGLGLLKANVPGISKVVVSLTGLIKQLFSSFLQRKSYASIFLLGALNGILPCGLVLVALTFCLTLSSPFEGMLFMLTFGFGTLPVMLGLTGLISYAIKRYKLNFSNITAGMIFVSGILLIARVFITELPHHTGPGEGLVDIIICR